MRKYKGMIKLLVRSLVVLFALMVDVFPSASANLAPGVTVTPGAVNSVTIQRNGHSLAIYVPSADLETPPERLLLTHSRRDVVWTAQNPKLSGARISGPAAELEKFTGVQKYWEEMAATGTGQFHDYEQQSTKIITEPLLIDQAVKEGDILKWQNLSFRVIDTPGYSRGAVSYFIEIDKQKIGFVGDLIYGDGQLLDLYSLQDAIPGTPIRGYHGYAGRIGELITSLQKVKDTKCDLLVPARGPVIRNPGEAIEKLATRLKKVYANYLSINAGRWYFKPDYDTLAERALGSLSQVKWMPWAETIHEQPPEWVKVISNSRLIVSEDRSAFLVDCGSESIFNQVKNYQEKGTVTTIGGLFITHYHDDHTDFVSKAVKDFKCPVYATNQSADILENPRAYRYPAMTPNPIRDISVVPDGHKMQWKEFTFEFFYFPGQTIYHDSLLVTKNNGEKIFFIGDSFSPSGIDDYCLLNRNLLHQGMGYFYCLDFLKKLPPDVLLINQHIVQPFAFSSGQVELMIDVLKQRRDDLAQLFPWDDPNIGIDEQWASFYPYTVGISKGESREMSIRLFNHSDAARVFSITINAPDGIHVVSGQQEVSVPSRQEKIVSFSVSADNNVEPDFCVLTADISWKNWELNQWCEALLRILPSI